MYILPTELARVMMFLDSSTGPPISTVRVIPYNKRASPLYSTSRSQFPADPLSSVLTAPELGCVPNSDGVRPVAGAGPQPAVRAAGGRRRRGAAHALGQLLPQTEAAGGCLGFLG